MSYKPVIAILLSLMTAIAPAGCCKEEEVPALTRKLFSSIPKERNQAALDLARCGEKADQAVPRLSELLYDENVGVQSSAAYALRKIDTDAARAILERVEAARRKK